MSDAPKPMRTVTQGWGVVDPEGKALLAEHHRLCGPAYPGVKTPEEEAHSAGVTYFKVGYSGGPIYELTCPACRIRWRNG